MAVNNMDIETQSILRKEAPPNSTASTLEVKFYRFCIVLGFVLAALYLIDGGTRVAAGDGMLVEVRNQTGSPRYPQAKPRFPKQEPRYPTEDDTSTSTGEIGDDTEGMVDTTDDGAQREEAYNKKTINLDTTSPEAIADDSAAPVESYNNNNVLPHLSKQEILTNPRDLDASRPIPVDFQGKNLASIAGMKTLFRQAKERQRQSLKSMYGDYTDQLFPESKEFGTSILPGVVDVASSMNAKITERKTQDNSLGRVHFIDKLKLKLVQVQLKYLQAEGVPDTTLSRFVHMHGGHSSGAGHGNFFRESYTAVMERHLQPLFQSIGIHYVGRNMAAGGTSGADEVALCSNAYFGKDVDLQSWDYGMTDGKAKERQYIYAWRIAALSQLQPFSDDINDIPSRPAFMVLHYNQVSASSFAELEMRNLTTVALNEGTRQQISLIVPDSELLSESDIDQLPPFLRLFRCGGALETQGRCQEEKYNYTACEQRSHRTSWHPGHKSHALDGTLMAVGVMSALEEAMEQLAALEPANESKEDATVRLTELFHQLNDEEQKRYDNFLNSDVPIEKGNKNGDWLELMEDVVTYKDILTSPNFCHIAKMPSDQRFRGLVTENFDLTTINPAIERTFELALIDGEVERTENSRDPVAITNSDPRQDEFLLLSPGYEDCEIDTHLDGRDVFYTSSMHDWLHLTLPNNSEKQFYSEFDAKQSKGWVIVCFGLCSWGKCKPNDVQPGSTTQDLKSGRLEMEINGVSVDIYDKTGLGCHFLGHNTTDRSLRYTWTPNESGQYDIRARVADSEKFGYIKFSSFIFY